MELRYFVRIKIRLLTIVVHQVDLTRQHSDTQSNRVCVTICAGGVIFKDSGIVHLIPSVQRMKLSGVTDLLCGAVASERHCRS